MALALADAPSTAAARPQSQLLVTSCADDGSAGTLRRVVAGAVSGDVVDLSSLTCDRITLQAGEIVIGVANLTLLGPGQNALTIDGNHAGRVLLHDVSNGLLVVNGLTLANGRADSTVASPSAVESANGGCVFERASVSLVEATISGCTAIYTPSGQNDGVVSVLGGGLFVGGDAHLTNSNITYNIADGYSSGGGEGPGVPVAGGGVWSGRRIDLVGSVISGNGALTGTGDGAYYASVSAQGGGISLGVAGVIDVATSKIRGNVAQCNPVQTCGATAGGGIDGQWASQIAILSSDVSDNLAADGMHARGGGIANRFISRYPVSLTISKSTIAGNAALAGDAGGGGLYALNDTTIEYSTISGNSTSTAGGGIFLEYARLALSNCTVSGNSSADAGGIFLGNRYYPGYRWTSGMDVRNSTITANSSSRAGAKGGGVLDIHHTGASPSQFESTIIAGNSVPSETAGYADLMVTLGVIDGSHNLIVAANGITLPADTLDEDPLLASLQNNGGPTFTHALLLGSPALDTGSNSANLWYDQRGTGFPRTSGPGTDIGAFEATWVQTAVPPSVAVAFQPNLVQPSGSSTLTITFVNANATAATLTASVVDALPQPLVVASASGAATTCTGGTVLAQPGAHWISLGTGSSIPATGSCTVTVVVSSTPQEGQYVNAIAAGALETDLGSNADAATASLTVTSDTPIFADGFDGS